MKVTKSGVQTLEIFGKSFDFRFEYCNLNALKDDELVCEHHCPLSSVCDKIPDPRRYINPNRFGGEHSFNDFCVVPSTAFYGESFRVILSRLSGKILSEDELLEYFIKKDYIDKCFDLGFLKKVGDNFEIVDYTREELIEKEESLSEENREFLSRKFGYYDEDFWDRACDDSDLIPVKEDFIRYIKEVIINFIKFKRPFTQVIYKKTGEAGLVKEITKEGILVIFNSTNEQVCKVEDLELAGESEESKSGYKPFDLVLCKETGKWGVVKKSTEDGITVNLLSLKNYIEDLDLIFKPEELELL